MTASTIKQIHIEKLFGHYTYHLPSKGEEGLPADMSRLFMLYGDNGSGKTTILRLLFHMLAHADRSGHKTVLAKTPFARLLVELGDGASVEASRPNGHLEGGFSMVIRRPKKPDVSLILEVNGEGVITGHDETLPPFLEALRSLELHLFWLPDDRRLRGDSEDYDNEIYFGADDVEVWRDRNGRRRHLPTVDTQLLIYGTIKRFEVWIRRHALRGSSTGQANSDSIYTDVLKRIVRLPKVQPEDHAEPLTALHSRVQELGMRVESFSKYGLVPEFAAEDIASLLRDAPTHNHNAAYEVLNPYVEGLSARLDALEDAQKIIDNLVTSINSFFSSKIVRFDVRGGLDIVLEDGSTLEPGLLSSGERQMLVLLCTCVTAPTGSIFVIDEPELSLNIKWQRQLTGALLSCTEHSKVQFVLATHSFELLAGHKECVVQLRSVEE